MDAVIEALRTDLGKVTKQIEASRSAILRSEQAIAREQAIIDQLAHFGADLHLAIKHLTEVA